MITDSFSTASEPIITCASIMGPQRRIADRCILTFSDVILEAALDAYPCQTAGRIRSCGGMTPIYVFPDENSRPLGICKAHVGAAMAATDVIEINWLVGASQFVVFGSCGCLDREKTQGKYIIPTAAYRDEGMSYHYAPPADYIAMPGAETTARFFASRGLPFALGKTWTTDAFYRELRHQMEARKKEGCLAVDMEAAGIQAVCDHHGLKLYYFLAPGDVLDLPEWDVGGLREANHCLDNFRIALALAESLDASAPGEGS